MNRYIFVFTFILSISSVLTFGQSKPYSGEDSVIASHRATSIGGYGNAVYSRDANAESATMNLERVVLFVGHSFNSSTSLFTELEVEDAKVSGGDPGGEVAFEQAYVKFDLSPQHYITAGLFLPRIGILNENHLPTSFNGNERTQVETYILPSTWREIGIGFYGKLASAPFNYSFALMNGLNAADFSNGSGIREGRFEGREASANSLALNASAQYYTGDLKLQASGYYGGSVAMPRKQAEPLGLTAGPFGTPIAIAEADAEYQHGPWYFKALGTLISIPDAEAVNNAFSNNTPSREYGLYAEGAYSLLCPATIEDRDLLVFLRYERLDMNAEVPSNGTIDGSLNQSHIVTGLTFRPSSNVVVKGDVRFSHTSDQIPTGGVAPSVNNSYITIGIGYSF